MLLDTSGQNTVAVMTTKTLDEVSFKSHPRICSYAIKSNKKKT